MCEENYDDEERSTRSISPLSFFLSLGSLREAKLRRTSKSRDNSQEAKKRMEIKKALLFSRAHSFSQNHNREVSFTGLCFRKIKILQTSNL